MDKAIFKDKKICLNCKSETTYVNNQGRVYWYNHKGQKLCQKCYMKIIHNPRWSERMHQKYLDTPKEFLQIRDSRRLKFRNKRILVDKNPRTGTCKICHKKIGDEYINSRGQLAKIKRTNIHHVQYHNDDPLRDTEERCVSCHVYESWRLKKLVM